MYKHLLLFIIFCLTGLIVDAQQIKKKKPDAGTDAAKKNSDILPRLHFNSLDSLKDKSLAAQKKINYDIVIIKGDSSSRHNIPMAESGSGSSYYIPMYKGPNGPQDDEGTTKIPKKLLNAKNKKPLEKNIKKK